MGVWVWQQGWKLEWSGVLKMMQAESRQDYVGHMQRQLLHYICWGGEEKKKKTETGGKCRGESIIFFFVVYPKYSPNLFILYIIVFPEDPKTYRQKCFPPEEDASPKMCSDPARAGARASLWLSLSKYSINRCN